jgi:competence protein ComGC
MAKRRNRKIYLLFEMLLYLLLISFIIILIQLI